MPPLPPTHALLEITFVLGRETTRAYTVWSYKVISGAKVYKRQRHTKLPLGVAQINHVSDSEQVLALLQVLAEQIAEDDMPKAPAPPGGGATGGEQDTLDLGAWAG